MTSAHTWWLPMRESMLLRRLFAGLQASRGVLVDRLGLSLYTCSWACKS